MRCLRALPPPLSVALSPRPGAEELSLRQASAGPSLHRRAGEADQNGVPGGGSPSASAQRAVTAAAAAASLELWQLTAAPGQGRADWALEKCASLLLVMAHADAAVKATICSKDGLQSLLDCLQRLQPPHLAKASGARGGRTWGGVTARRPRPLASRLRPPASDVGSSCIARRLRRLPLPQPGPSPGPCLPSQKRPTNAEPPPWLTSKPPKALIPAPPPPCR